MDSETEIRSHHSRRKTPSPSRHTSLHPRSAKHVDFEHRSESKEEEVIVDDDDSNRNSRINRTKDDERRTRSKSPSRPALGSPLSSGVKSSRPISQSRSRSRSPGTKRRTTTNLPTLSKGILKPDSGMNSPYAESLPSPIEPSMDSIFKKMTDPIVDKISSSPPSSTKRKDSIDSSLVNESSTNMIRSRSLPSLRRRSSKSSTTNETNRATQESPKQHPSKFSHTYLVHTVVRVSPLSKESNQQEYRGFFNLALLLLAVSNIRLVIENFVKYGLLLNHKTTSLRQSDVFWVCLSLGIQVIPIYFAHWIEVFGNRLISSKRFKELPLWPLHSMNVIFLISIATFISWSLIVHPAMSFIPLFTATILFLKLISYALVNNDLRQEAILNIHLMPIADKASKEGRCFEDALEFDVNDVPYPTNLTMANLSYFCMAPTLCYQTAFPQTKRVRHDFLFKRICELMVALAGAYFFTFQYAEPTLRNSLDAFEKMDLIRLVERVLKLSVISVTLWLLLFWSFFHCALNIIAELLQFGDRRFYQHWWNAKDISEYWRLWNSPVYVWAKRHVYLPLILNYNVNPMLALLIVFTVSALLHELLIGVPTHTLNGVAFFGMLGQIPLIFFTKLLATLRNSWLGGPGREKLFDTIGNYIFWLTFTIVGQPTCILIYYSHWYRRHMGDSIHTTP